MKSGRSNPKVIVLLVGLVVVAVYLLVWRPRVASSPMPGPTATR